jgi:PBP1b-binding outer membrane lipoprotein LpoB
MAQTIHLPKEKEKNMLSLRLAPVFALLLLLSSCASTPQPPTSDLQAAEQAIASAERARVADYASVELSVARDKLSAARSAVQEEKMVQAQRLAQQAKADAELASARAEVARARVVNEQMQTGTDTLNQEMQRNTGDQ